MRQFLPFQPNLHTAGNLPAKMRYSFFNSSNGNAVRRFAGILAMILLFSSGIMAVTTITVTGLSIGTQICPGSQTNVNLIVDTTGGATMPAGTYTWAIELSDPNGNFPGTVLAYSPPTNIGASKGYTGGVGLGPIDLPSSLAQSNLYKIRSTVIGYPAVNSVASPTLDARRELLAPTLPTPLQYNAGGNITVTVNRGTCGFNPGNVFTVQLSNAAGSFASPVNLAPTLNNSSGGNVIVTIPENTPYGTGYRIRIVSSNPALNGPDNGSNITIICSNPTNGGQIASSHTLCPGNVPSAFTSISLPSGHTGTLEYQWQKSTTSASSGFNNISGANSATFAETAPLTHTTWYKRLAKVTCESNWAESNVLSVQVYTYSIALNSGQLIFTDICGNSDEVNISESGANIRFDVASAYYSYNGGAPQAFPADIPLSGLTSIAINAGAGDDDINLGAFTANLPNLLIDGGNGSNTVLFSGAATYATNNNLEVLNADIVTINAPQTLSGSGSIDITANQSMNVNAKLNNSSGPINLSTTGGEDIIVQAGVNGIYSTAGVLIIQAGRDLLLGNGSNYGDARGQKVELAAGRDIVVDMVTYIQSDGSGGLTAEAGRNITISNSSLMNTNGGGAPNHLTTGTNGLLTIAAGSSIGANNGAIVLTADKITLEGSVGTGGIVTLQPVSAGRSINLGTETSGSLSLIAAELNQVTAGTLIIGNEDSGEITVSDNINRPASTVLELVSSGNIEISGGGINTGGGNLLLSPGDSPAAVVPSFTGTDVSAGTLSFASDLSIEINGTTPGTQYQQLIVVGQIDLTGVDLALSGSYSPTFGDSFLIVDNDGVDQINGTFTGLDEGDIIADFLGSGLYATITYLGGDGNDVVLQVPCSNPTDGGQIASSQTLCSGDVPAPFTSISPASGFVGDLEYQWQISTLSPTFVDIPGAFSDTYTHVGTVTQTSWFRRLARVGCATGTFETNSVSSNMLEVSVFPIGLRTWTGTTDADWNTDANWNPPCVPTADDNVIIPDVTTDPVIGTALAAVAKSVTVNADAALTVVETGSLTINGSSLHEFGFYAGLYNHGSVTNDGLIVLGSVSNVGEVGLWNIGTFTNTGEIQIDRSTLSALWSAEGQFTNSSLINIGATESVGQYGLYNDASFNNTADGQVVINNFTQRGLENRAGEINNSGGITIGFLSGTGQRSIMNQALFNNNPGGEIYLDRATAVGVYNNATGLFNNAALLNIGGTVSVGQAGIQNIGTFTNTLSGEIYIDRTTFVGLYNNGGGSKFTNAALLVIGNSASVGNYGVGNEGTFTNILSGEIRIDRSTQFAFSSVGPVSNSGLIKIGSMASVGTRGMQNVNSAFTNTQTGEIHIDRSTELGIINSKAQFTNDGKIFLGVNQSVGGRGINNQDAGNNFLNSSTGEITIDKTTEYAFVNSYHTNENAGKLTIGGNTGVDGHGIYLFFSSGLTNTGSGEIRIDRTTDSGIYVENLSTFTNNANIIIGKKEAMEEYGIENEGSFTNGECATITMYAPLSNGNVFTNNGLLSSITTEQHAGTAVIVNSPAGVAGSYNFVAATFGADVGSSAWTADAVLVSDAGGSSLGCYAPYQNAAQLVGKIALIDRGTCEFGLKCLLAEQAGAIAAIVINNINGPAFLMGAGAYGAQVTIPCVLISKADGDAIKAAGAVNMSIGNIATPANAVINNGIIEFPLGNPIASIDNNQVVVAPFSGDCSVSISPALQLGDLADFVIAETWYEDEDLTIPAGDYDQPSNTFLPLPTLSGNVTTLYFNVTDPVGGCTSTVSVQVSFNDDLIPDAVCKNITVYLDGNSVTVYAEDVNDGSTDNCSDPALLTLSPASITYTCDHIGTNSFVLTVTDAKGNAASCTATVTVLDGTPPVPVSITKTVYLDPYGVYKLLDTDVLDFGASFDNCGPITVTGISPASFDCNDLGGVFPVLVQVEDPSGNSAQATATITVEQGTALLPPWENANTHASANGTAIYSPCDNEGTFRLTSTGQSTTTRDVHHIVYQDVCDNQFTIIARLTGMQNLGWGGVVVRQGTGNNDRAILVKTQLSNRVIVGYRKNPGLAMVNSGAIATIKWMKIQRNGTNFKVFTSANGTTWQQRYNGTLNMTGCLKAGIFLESIYANRTAVATFDNVELATFLKSGEENAGFDLIQPELQSQQVEVYPNPADDYAIVSIPENEGKVSYQLTDMDGRLIEQNHFTGSEAVLDLSNLRPGMYVLRLEVKGEIVTRRIVVM